MCGRWLHRPFSGFKAFSFLDPAAVAFVLYHCNFDQSQREITLASLERTDQQMCSGIIYEFAKLRRINKLQDKSRDTPVADPETPRPL